MGDSETKRDQQTKMRALEMYSRLKQLDSQRESNNRSLMVAAAGAIVLVGGAAATVADKPDASRAALLVALAGCLTEVLGLVAFVKSAK